MIIRKIIPAMILLVLTAAVSSPAAAVEYHPGDVAVISKMLKHNDSKNKVLAEAGWRPDRPETWINLPGREESCDALTWDGDGRLRTLVLWDCELTGSLDLTGLEGLTRLDLSDNHLTGVRGLAGLHRPEETNLSYNRRTGAGDLDGLPTLRGLGVSNHELTGLGERRGPVKM